MSSPKRQENIVIIGGGVIGCTTAYYLTRHPRFDPSRHIITILEAATIANGASSKAGGLLASWASPGNISALSFDLHSELATEHRGTERWGYRRVRCGHLTAAVGQPQMRHCPVVTHEWNASSSTIKLGKWWKSEEMKASLLPSDLDWLKPDSAQSYEEFSDTSSTAQVHPLQFTVAIAKLAEQAGARIIYGTVHHINCSTSGGVPEESTPLTACHNWSQKRVVSITYTDKVTAQKYDLPATIAVLAAGPWTTNLLPKLRMSPLRAHSISITVNRPVSAYCLFTEITVGDSLLLDTKGSLTKSSPRKTICAEIYARPNNEVYICSQGDLDVPLPSPTEVIAVSELSCRDVIEAAATISDELKSGQVTGRGACYLPVIDIRMAEGPLVGETGLEGLLLATGHSCWGILNAPATGKAISELVFDGEISCMQAENLDPRSIFSKSESPDL